MTQHGETGTTLADDEYHVIQVVKKSEKERMHPVEAFLMQDLEFETVAMEKPVNEEVCAKVEIVVCQISETHVEQVPVLILEL